MNTNKYWLFLDDERVPTDCVKYTMNSLYGGNWLIVRSYKEFVKCIEDLGMPELISFDHDLGNDVAKERHQNGMSKRKARSLKKEEKTGCDCAKWLLKFCDENQLNMPQFLVHSMNPVGSKNIINVLSGKNSI